MIETELPITQGLPRTMVTTVTGGATLWPNGPQVYGQVRQRPGKPLLLDLTPYLTHEVDGDDLKVTLTLSGRVTRLLPRSGRYDIFVAEAGVEQLRSIRVAHGELNLTKVVSDGPAPVV